MENILIGSACAVIAAVALWSKRDFFFFRWRSRESVGTITQWMSAREKGTLQFRPLIEFQTVAGEKKTFLAEERCADKPIYPTGTKVIVRYLSSDPTQVKTKYPERAD